MCNNGTNDIVQLALMYIMSVYIIYISAMSRMEIDRE